VTALYLGNSSKFVVELNYRLPEDNPRHHARVLVLQPGTQMRLPGNAPKDFLDDLIQRHLIYGWIAAGEISRQADFAGVIYSFDKIIPENALYYVIDANDGKLDERSRLERQRMAVAASGMAMNNGEQPTPKEFEMSIREVDAPRGAQALPEEGILVSNEGGTRPSRGGRRKAA
jgi:hypothetical protein